MRGAFTPFQRAVVGVAAALIVLRLFAPVQYVLRTNIVSYVPGVWFGGSPSEEELIRAAIGTTLLHALALAILALALCVLFPDPAWRRNKRMASMLSRMVLALSWEPSERARVLSVLSTPRNKRLLFVLAGLGLFGLAWVLVPQGQVKPEPTVPTVDDLEIAPQIVGATGTAILYLHEAWQDIDPYHRTELCQAGATIRATMKAYQKKPIDLPPAIRAVYSITAPRGRCL